jgi:predicted RNase H-like HicB family nuclease
MNVQYIISEYLNRALAHAEYDKLEDGTFSGRIASCSGVIAFGATLRACEDELRSTLEDWLLVGLKLGHTLPELPTGETFSRRGHRPRRMHASGS